MTIREQIEAVEQLRKLWELSFPTIEPPPNGTFASWIGAYPQSIIAFALSRTVSKVRRMDDAGTPMQTADAARYTASVMRNEYLGRNAVIAQISAATKAA